MNNPLLHNIGGPISRRKSEKIRSSITRQSPLARQTLTLSVELPPGTDDLQAWLADMARQRGFKSLDEAEKALALPGKRLIARILNPTTDGTESQDTLRNALILAVRAWATTTPAAPASSRAAASNVASSSPRSTPTPSTTWTERQVADIMADLADENPFACQALLQITGTRFTTEVPTLAVTLSEEPLLLVNPRFLEQNAHTEADIRCFLLHEFLHVVLRHTETYDENTPLLNIALDAVINAIIHRTCGPELSDTFCRLYKPTGMMCLLRPWDFGADRSTTRRWKSCHERIYSGAIAADDLHELLQALQQENECPDGILLIGNHGADGSVSKANAERLEDILKRMTGVRIWNHRDGPGQGNRLERLEQRIRNIRTEAWHRETARLIEEVLQPDPTRIGNHPVETRLPILSPGDRRAFATLRQGGILPFATHLLNGRAPIETARVYLDTSGSMDNVLQEMVALLSRFHTRIRQPLHAFSNRVSDARIEDGKLLYDSTMGTSIACVFDHIRSQRPGKCLIVTDGYVEDIDKHMLRDIPLTSLRVLVTANGVTQPFERHRIPCHRLKNLDA